MVAPAIWDVPSVSIRTIATGTHEPHDRSSMTRRVSVVAVPLPCTAPCRVNTACVDAAIGSRVVAARCRGQVWWGDTRMARRRTLRRPRRPCERWWWRLSRRSATIGPVGEVRSRLNQRSDVCGGAETAWVTVVSAASTLRHLYRPFQRGAYARVDLPGRRVPEHGILATATGSARLNG